MWEVFSENIKIGAGIMAASILVALLIILARALIRIN